MIIILISTVSSTLFTPNKLYICSLGLLFVTTAAMRFIVQNPKMTWNIPSLMKILVNANIVVQMKKSDPKVK